MRRRFVVLAFVLAACGSPPRSGPPRADAAVTPDAAARDAAPVDGRAVDAPVLATDAAVSDATVPDVTVPDATIPDAAVPDAGVPDAALPDAFVADAIPALPTRTADAGMPLGCEALDAAALVESDGGFGPPTVAVSPPPVPGDDSHFAMLGSEVYLAPTFAPVLGSVVKALANTSLVVALTDDGSLYDVSTTPPTLIDTGVSEVRTFPYQSPVAYAKPMGIRTELDVYDVAKTPPGPTIVDADVHSFDESEWGPVWLSGWNGSSGILCRFGNGRQQETLSTRANAFQVLEWLPGYPKTGVVWWEDWNPDDPYFPSGTLSFSAPDSEVFALGDHVGANVASTLDPDHIAYWSHETIGGAEHLLLHEWISGQPGWTRDCGANAKPGRMQFDATDLLFSVDDGTETQVYLATETGGMVSLGRPQPDAAPMSWAVWWGMGVLLERPTATPGIVELDAVGPNQPERMLSTSAAASSFVAPTQWPATCYASSDGALHGVLFAADGSCADKVLPGLVTVPVAQPPATSYLRFTWVTSAGELREWDLNDANEVTSSPPGVLAWSAADEYFYPTILYTTSEGIYEIP